MGELLGRWSRALDSNLAILTTAKLYTYDSVATSTPKTTYSDAALTTPLSNPVSADASGRFPQVFAGDGQAFYLVLRSNTIGAGGVIIEQFNNVQALGTSAGDIIGVDFGAGGKWQVRGDSGTGMAHMEFGDPDPDVVGGSGVIGGWLGTQLDTLSIDAAAANVTGKLKEGGYKLPGIVRTESTVFTAVTNVVIPMPNDPAGCLVYDIDITGFSQSGNANLFALFSYDNGVSYKTGGADYSYNTGASFYPGAAPTVGGAGIQLGSNHNGSANHPGFIRLRLITPNSGNDCAYLEVRTNGVLNTGDYATLFGFGYGGATYGRVTHVKLNLTANNMTGKYRVEPQRGFGEP